jgi:hypothetical protein
MIEIVVSAGINQKVFALSSEISKVKGWYIVEMEFCGIRECNIKTNKNEQLNRSRIT